MGGLLRVPLSPPHPLTSVPLHRISNSRFSIIFMRCRFVVATSVACYAVPTTEVVTTNAITGIADTE
ncbi:MAG: hypothetical protein MAG451_02473 [Anaerolineales bacterium]|nr:hypothetical protein [Anaerolineales bacterium]